MVDKAWNLTIEAQDHQQALATTAVGIPSVCRLLGGQIHKIDPQTREAVNVVFFRSTLLYWTYNIY